MMTLLGEDMPEPKPKKKKGKKKDKPPPPEQPSMAEIEGIYALYPRHVAKPTAIESIRKAWLIIQARDVLSPTAWLMDVVRRYAEAVKGQDRKYVPYPSTWFNQGRYDDDSCEWEAWKSGGQGFDPDSDMPSVGFLDKIQRDLDQAKEKEAIKRQIREAF